MSTAVVVVARAPMATVAKAAAGVASGVAECVVVRVAAGGRSAVFARTRPWQSIIKTSARSKALSPKVARLCRVALREIALDISASSRLRSSVRG